MDRAELTECIRTKQKVVLDESLYIPQAYILRLVKTKWHHSAELKDIKANCIVIADLERIEKYVF